MNNLKKSLIYQGLSFICTNIVIFLFTEALVKSILLALLLFCVKTAYYYYFEVVWRLYRNKKKHE